MFTDFIMRESIIDVLNGNPALQGKTNYQKLAAYSNDLQNSKTNLNENIHRICQYPWYWGQLHDW